jgi:hypothetical protein
MAPFFKELSRFFWQDMNGCQKYHMVKWADICAPKEHGGIGILAAHCFNKALMLKWVWRILRDEGGCMATFDQGQISSRPPPLGM